MKKQARKMMSMSLAAALALTSMPISVFAEDTALKAPIVENVDKEEQPVVEEETTVEEQPVVEEETTVEEQPVVEEGTTTEEQPTTDINLVDIQSIEKEAEAVKKSELQTLIDNAEEGSTIKLEAKTYTLDKSLIINKSVNIVGTEGTVIDGSNSVYPVFGNGSNAYCFNYSILVYADNVTIEGVKIIGKTSAIGVGNNDTSKTPYFADDESKTPLYSNYPTDGHGYEGFTLENCVVTTAAENGDIGNASLIQLDGSNATIINNVIRDVTCGFAKVKIEKLNCTVKDNMFINVDGTGALIATKWDQTPPTNVIEPNIQCHAYVESETELTNALATAEDGDKIIIADGTYNVGTLRVDKAVSFEGQGEDTIIVGSINYYCGDYEGDIKVSNLTVKSPENNTKDQQAIWWSYNTANPLDGANLIVENCTVVDYLFGIGVNSSTENCNVYVKNLKLDNVWCGSNVSEGAGNTIKEYSITDDSTVVYEVQVFGNYNAYYKTWEDCEKDTNRENPALNSNDKMPDISKNNWPAVAEVNGYYYGTLESAVANAKEGETIKLKAGTYDVGTLRILKRINIQGSGADDTIIKGNLIYSVDATDATMSVSNVTLQADDTNNEKAIIWSMRYDANHTGTLTNCTLNVSDCIVKGYKYGVTLDTNANSCSLNITNTEFTNTWCAISSKEDSVNSENGITFEGSTSDGEYVVQEFGTSTGGNSYYKTIDDYEKKKDGTPADEAGIYVSTSEQLQNALATAKAGDTIKIGAGEYELAANQWGGTPVNLIGAGVGKTIIKDALWRGGANGNVITGIETLSVEGITFVNEDGINNWSNVGLGFTNIDGCTITVKDCEFDGWQYGVHMNGANPGTTVNFENIDFNNTFIAMSAGISEGTGIGTIKNVKTTDGALAVQVFGNDDYHYYSVDAFNTARGSELTPAIENINNKNLVEGVDYEDVDGALKGYVVTEGESIQGAIDKLSASKNIVVVAPGTYDEDVTFNDKSVTVKGSGEDTIFSGCFNTTNGGTNADAFKSDQKIVIDGFAFTGNGLKVGATHYSTVGELVVRNCTMEFGENLEGNTSNGRNQLNYFVKVSSVSPDAKVVLEDNVVTGNPPTLDGTSWIYPIQLWGVKDVTVTGNEILLGTESAEHPIDAINVSVMNDEANVTISDNIIENCKNGINVSTWKLNGTNEDTGAYTGNVTINDNELKNVTGDKISIGAIEKDYPDFNGNVSASGNIDEKGNAVVPKIVFSQNEEASIEKAVINIISDGNTLERHVVDKDSEFKLPDKLSKEGYRFMGWSSEEGTIYDENSKVTVTEDAEFTAVWVKNSSPESDDSSSSSSSSSGTTEDIEDEDTPLTGEVEELPFTDVNEEAWYKEAVKYVYENEMMSGITSTTFGPNVTTTRGMIVTILYRLEGEPAVEELAKFDDVTSDAYYAKAVAWASANGVVSGYNETTFGPNDTITREQFASILYRYAQLKGYEVTEKGDITVFTDATKVSAWAKEAVEWAVGSKLITGKGAGMLDPTGTATRAEAAQMLMNFCENK